MERRRMDEICGTCGDSYGNHRGDICPSTEERGWKPTGSFIGEEQKMEKELKRKTKAELIKELISLRKEQKEIIQKKTEEAQKPLMTRIAELEDNALAEIEDIKKACEAVTGRTLKPNLGALEVILNDLDRGDTLKEAMKKLGRWVKENRTFDTGKQFLDWAGPIIIEAGRCR